MHKKLSQKEFSHALEKGQGRAWLHAVHHGLEGVEDVLLNACLHNISYDPQCSESRAGWLFSMFKDSPSYPQFSQAICSALQQAPEGDSYDLAQLCELAAEIGRNGDETAATILREKVWKQNWQPLDDATHRPFGIQAVIALDEVSAVIEFARLYGKLLRQEAQPYTDNQLVYWGWNIGYAVEQMPFKEQANDALRKLAQSDEDIQAYVKNEERLKAHFAKCDAQRDAMSLAEKRAEVLKKADLEYVLNDSLPERCIYPELRNFGRYATSEELGVVFDKFLEISDESACARLLWVFHEAFLPYLHPKLWQAAQSQNDDLRSNALEALSQTSDPDVAKFGRTLIQSKQLSTDDEDIIGLFINNYEPGDEKLILNALKRLKDPDGDSHSLCGRIIYILQNNEGDELADLAYWVYENIYCEVCRKDAVEWLCEYGLLDSQTRQECLHDANPNIVQMILDSE